MADDDLELVALTSGWVDEGMDPEPNSAAQAIVQTSRGDVVPVLASKPDRTSRLAILRRFQESSAAALAAEDSLAPPVEQRTSHTRTSSPPPGMEPAVALLQRQPTAATCTSPVAVPMGKPAVDESTAETIRVARAQQDYGGSSAAESKFIIQHPWVRIQALARGRRARKTVHHTQFVKLLASSKTKRQQNFRPVIDWMKLKSPELAETYDLLQRPCYVYRSTERKERTMTTFQVLKSSTRAAYAVDDVDQVGADLSGDSHSAATPGALSGASIDRLFSVGFGRLPCESYGLAFVWWGTLNQGAKRRLPFTRKYAEITPARSEHGKGWLLRRARDVGDVPQQYPVCGSTNRDLGLIGGVGLRLYFDLQLLLRNMFFGAGLLSLPAIVTNLGGDMYQSPATRSYAASITGLIARTTVGNIAIRNNSNTYSQILYFDDTLSPPMPDELWVVSYSTAATTIFLLCVVVRLSTVIDNIIADTDNELISMSDYSMQITPETPSELAKWSEAYKSLSQNPQGVGNKGKQKMLQADIDAAINAAMDSNHNIVATIEGQKQIFVAFDESKNIALWKEKESKFYELEASIARAARYDSLAETSIASLQATIDNLAQVNRKLREQNVGLSAIEWAPVRVYVVLENPSDLDKLIRKVQTLTIAGAKCRLEAAREPETIIWENLEVSARERKIRRRIILFATLLLMLCGCVLIVAANIQSGLQEYTGQCESVMPPATGYSTARTNASICPNPPAANNGYAVAFLNAYQTTHAAATDATENARLVVDHFNGLIVQAHFPRIDIPSHLADASQYRAALGDICYENSSSPWSAGVAAGWAEWQLKPLTATDSTAFSCHRMDRGGIGDIYAESFLVHHGGNMDAMCYACFCQLAQVPVRAALDAQFAADGRFTRDYCAQFETDKTNAAVWKIVAGLLVVAVNQGMKHLIIYTASNLRAEGAGEQMESQSMRVFMCQLINTALLSVLARSTLPGIRQLPGDHLPGANAKWYATVGASMVVTMVAQFVVAPFMHVVQFYLFKLKLRWKSKRALTQNQLNRAHRPSFHDLAGSYAELLMALSVTILFGPAVPLLYWVAAFGFGLREIVERWAVLRVYATVGLHSKITFQSTDEISACCVLVSAFLACWSVGSAAGNYDNPNSKAIPVFPFRPTCLPVTVTFFVVALTVLLKFVTEKTNICSRGFSRVSRKHRANYLTMFEIGKYHRRTVHVLGCDAFLGTVPASEMDAVEKIATIKLLLATAFSEQSLAGDRVCDQAQIVSVQVRLRDMEEGGSWALVTFLSSQIAQQAALCDGIMAVADTTLRIRMFDHLRSSPLKTEHSDAHVRAMIRDGMGDLHHILSKRGVKSIRHRRLCELCQKPYVLIPYPQLGFREAYAEGKISNLDADFEMDQMERVRDLTEVFVAALRRAKRAGASPFSREAIARLKEGATMSVLKKQQFQDKLYDEIMRALTGGSGLDETSTTDESVSPAKGSRRVGLLRRTAPGKVARANDGLPQRKLGWRSELVTYADNPGLDTQPQPQPQPHAGHRSLTQPDQAVSSSLAPVAEVQDLMGHRAEHTQSTQEGDEHEVQPAASVDADFNTVVAKLQAEGLLEPSSLPLREVEKTAAAKASRAISKVMQPSRKPRPATGVGVGVDRVRRRRNPF